MTKPYTAYDHVDVTYASDTKADARTIGRVAVEVDAIVTDERYHECMSALRAANERMDALESENDELRKLCSKMRTIIKDFDETPYVTERPGKNPAVTWLEPDWEPIEECDEAMKSLGIEVEP